MRVLVTANIDPMISDALWMVLDMGTAAEWAN